MSTHLKLLNWNVRGLNDRARRTVVRNLVLTSRCSILSVQESKLGALTGNDITDIVGQTLTGFAQLPALGTRGGVLLFWCPDRFHATNVDVREFSITVTLVDRQYGHAWSLTSVYGPSDDTRKREFLKELVAIHAQISGAWMVIGDFNIILHDTDKNKPRVNISWMRKFKSVLDASYLREIKLVGRRFTWSNEQDDPTLVRLDRAFCNSEWDDMHPAAKLLPQASSMSDHCPLLLVQDLVVNPPPQISFRKLLAFATGV
jgi:exonuclease III